MKDISFQMKLYREFVLLFRDLVFLLPTLLLTLCLMIRAKTLFMRLRRIQAKKREKREIQTLLWLQTLQRII